MTPTRPERIIRQVMSAATEVHKHFGPGLLENVYRECLCHELRERSLPYERDAPVPVRYKGLAFDAGLRLDLLVDKAVVVDILTVPAIGREHQARLITQLRLSGMGMGLILNFDVPSLPDGIMRIGT